LNDADNESALMLAVIGPPFAIFGPQPKGDEETAVKIVKVLLDAGARLNDNSLYNYSQRTRGGTALHYAVRAGWPKAVQALVDAGIDVNIKDPDGLTALDYAMARGYIPFLHSRQPPRLDIAQILRDNGATVELDAEPDWPPVGPPVYYEATIPPLAPDTPSKSYEDLKPSESLVHAVDNMQYP
jgi:ankyrin repeat protein